MPSDKMRPARRRPDGSRDCSISDYGVPKNIPIGPTEQAGRGKATAEDRATAHAIVAFVKKRRREGATNTKVLIEIDRHWPGIKFKIVLAAYFLDQLAASGELPQ
jgi:hypothetical protein